MKKLIAMLGLCMATTSMNSQTYGETIYPRLLSTLSYGGTTTINSSGFLMAGFRAVGGSTDDNFYIDKTDDGGVFGTSGSFAKRYALRHLSATGTACTPGPLTWVGNCAGVTTMETAIGGGASNAPAYAVAGAYDRGVFFCCLTPSGVPLTPKVYYFPATPVRVTKPLIADASAFATNSFFICGSYEDTGGTTYTYIFVVDQVGNILTQDVIDVGTTGETLEARAIMPSLNTPGNLVVVGVVNAGVSNKGFFMEITPGTGLAPTIDAYGQASGGTEEFNCIAESQSGDYLIGGYTDLITAAGASSWFFKRNSTGSVVFSSVFEPVSIANWVFDIGVQSITEAPSASIPGASYVYGITQAPQGVGGIVAMKLDASGNAYVGTGLTDYNTFHYDTRPLGLGYHAVPEALSWSMSGDIGIHVYGNTNTVPGEHYMVRAYLNGEEACLPMRDPDGVTYSGPSTLTNPTAFNNSPFGSACSNFNILDNGVTGTLLSDVCTPLTTMTSGSNNRTTMVTGLTKNNSSAGYLGLSPNPTNNVSLVSYRQHREEKAVFTLYNQLGQTIKTFDTASTGAGEHQLEIDLSGLEAGIYYLNAEMDGQHFSEKIVHLGH